METKTKATAIVDTRNGIEIQNGEQITQEVPQGCLINCHCEQCQTAGYSAKLYLENQEMFIFGGPLMVRLPVSNFYHIIGFATLNYRLFHQYQVGQLIKLKCTHLDFLPGLKTIALTLNGQIKKEYTVNNIDVAHWFIGCVKAKLFQTKKVGFPSLQGSENMLGLIWVKTLIKGWVKRGAEITDRLRIQDEADIREVKQLWTRFEVIDVQGLCLVIKFWDFWTKWQLGIPFKGLSSWLTAFLKLVKN